jgi:hypothetical protein
MDCLACQDEFFVNNLLDFKENIEHAFFPNPCLVIARVSLALLPRFAQNVGSIKQTKQTPWSESATERPPLLGEVIANFCG